MQTKSAERQCTVWRNPAVTMPTEYGIVTYQEWCQKEIARIGVGNSRRLFIKSNDKEQIAIFER